MKIVIANSKDWFNLNKNVENKNDILFIKNADDLKLSLLEEFKPNLIFFPHWNSLVSEDIVKNYKCILFHTAPLPYGKGGSPIQNLILKGFSEAPVCAIKMTSRLDSGPIYIKKKISLKGNLSEIFKRLNKVVNQIIKELIEDLPKPQQQVGEEFIFKRLKDKDNILPFDANLEDIFNRIRMLDDPSYPNAYIEYGDKCIEFRNAKIIDNKIFCEAIINLKH